jgi:hypothetical protein
LVNSPTVSLVINAAPTEVTFYATPTMSASDFLSVPIDNNTTGTLSISVSATVTVTSTGATHSSGTGGYQLPPGKIGDLYIDFQAWAGAGAFTGTCTVFDSSGNVIVSTAISGTL